MLSPGRPGMRHFPIQHSLEDPIVKWVMNRIDPPLHIKEWSDLLQKTFQELKALYPMREKQDATI